MNPLAKELNDILQNTVIAKLLSSMGQNFYFPKGIVSQSAEATEHATRYNATIGIAQDGLQPIHFSSIRNLIPELDVNEIYPYAPNPGVLKFRQLWKEQLLKKNPELVGKKFTLPLVTTGITNGISLIGDMFIDAGDKIILPDLYWGNYKLIFEVRRQGQIITFPFFKDNVFNLEGFRQILKQQAGQGKIIVLLNFPNNPTGYTPTVSEAGEIITILKECAKQGNKMLVIFDDSYFSLFYEEATSKQSLFAYCADLHPNLLAVKLDGATKEDYVWGFRLGFITFAVKGLDDNQAEALLKKTKGLIRSTVSNCNLIGQNLLVRAMQSDTYEKEKKAAYQLLKVKYNKVREVLGKLSSTHIVPLPFNSGYFMCFQLYGVDAEKLRQYLLFERGIGTISIQDNYLRIAYSCIELADMEELYREIYTAAEKLA